MFIKWVVVSMLALATPTDNSLNTAFDLYTMATSVAKLHANSDGSLEEGGRQEAISLARQSMVLLETMDPTPTNPLMAVANLLVDLLTASPPAPSSPNSTFHSVPSSSSSTTVYHFLHIPKTGGTSISTAAKGCPLSVVAHGHELTFANFTQQQQQQQRQEKEGGGQQQQQQQQHQGGGGGQSLSGSSEGVEVVALVRDPVGRFVSSFVFFKEGGYRGAYKRRTDPHSVREGLEALATLERVVALLEKEVGGEDEDGTQTVTLDESLEVAAGLERLASLTWAQKGDPHRALDLARRAALKRVSRLAGGGQGGGGDDYGLLRGGSNKASVLLGVLEMTTSHPIHSFATPGELVDAMRRSENRVRESECAGVQSCDAQSNGVGRCGGGDADHEPGHNDHEAAVANERKAWAAVNCQENMLHLRQEDADACRAAGKDGGDRDGRSSDPFRFHIAFRSQISWLLNDTTLVGGDSGSGGDGSSGVDGDGTRGGGARHDGSRHASRPRLRIFPFEAFQQCSSSQPGSPQPTLASCFGFEGCNAPLPHLNGRSAAPSDPPLLSSEERAPGREQVKQHASTPLTDVQATWVRGRLYPEDSLLHACALQLAATSTSPHSTAAKGALTKADYDRHWECVEQAWKKRRPHKKRASSETSSSEPKTVLEGTIPAQSGNEETWL